MSTARRRRRSAQRPPPGSRRRQWRSPGRRSSGRRPVGLLQRSPVARRQQLRLASLRRRATRDRRCGSPSGRAGGSPGSSWRRRWHIRRGARQASSSSGPAARWIAPSTPPPPSSELFAALTMASVVSMVMSPSTTSKRGAMALTVLPHGLGVVHRCERPSASEEAAMSGLRGRGTQEWPIAPMKAMTAARRAGGRRVDVRAEVGRPSRRSCAALGDDVDAVSSTGKPKLPQWPWLATAVARGHRPRRRARRRGDRLRRRGSAHVPERRSGGPRSRLRRVRPARPRRRRPARSAVERAAGVVGGDRATDVTADDHAGQRRRRGDGGGDAGAALRGHRRQADLVDVPVRPARPGVGQGQVHQRPGDGRRRLQARRGQSHGLVRLAARRRPRRRRTACSSSAPSAPGSTSGRSRR